MAKSEFEKLVETDNQITKWQKDLAKVHEIALLEKEEGEMPYICNGGKMFGGFANNLWVYIEDWENAEAIPARELEIQETKPEHY